MAAPIDPKIKAAALAELATGAPIARTAKKYGVARNSLKSWWAESGLTTVRTVEQKDQLGEAIDAWTVKAVQALTVQLDLAMDLGWLRGHSPADFAALITVLADQVARLAQTEQSRQDEDSAPTPMRRAS